MKLKYLSLLALLLVLNACNEPEDVLLEAEGPEEIIVASPALTTGSVDFSKYVAVGNSLTAGYTDGALFIASQENSMANMLASKFALLGGGEFTQPLMNDNFGGLLAGGNQIQEARFVFNGEGPQRLAELNPSVVPTTDIFVNNPSGPFNNLGVPGAKAIHLVFPGYGSPANLVTKTANPYFVRMTGASPNITVLEMATAQNATFFSLWAGNNDVLGYAVSGGDGTDLITPKAQFDGAIGALVAGLTAGGAKGVIANIPYVSTIPHFTTVPHNPIPLDKATADLLNSATVYGAYNAGITQAFAYLVSVGAVSQEDADTEIAKRTIVFAESETNAAVILDENLTDLTVINPALVNIRQATAEDLLVLSAASFIGTEAVEGNPLTVNGVAVPLGDKWVLTPEEQAEIKAATDEFNETIKVAADAAGLAFVDANEIMKQMAENGHADGDFVLTSDLVTGGAFSLDGVHLTARGYAAMGNEFLKAIDATYGSNFENSESLFNIIDYPTNYAVGLQ